MVSGSDFDGDGKTDPAKYVTSSATLWYIESSTATLKGVYVGAAAGDYIGGAPATRVAGTGDGGLTPPRRADFDGDGKTDPAKYDADSIRYLPSTGGTWQTISLATETYEYDEDSGNLSKKNGVSYTYDTQGTNDTHAVVYRSNGDEYVYDANGNMTERTVDDQTFYLAYDAENRLAEVVSGAFTAEFVYDGDPLAGAGGQRVKATIDDVDTYFVGNLYEKTGETETKYYYAGGSRIAMRVDGTLKYLLSDHLGSTTVVTDATGNLVSELKYKPWGEVRSGTAQTKYTFTGQYSNVSDFGLLFYNARWYDPYLNRWTQPDTIVPDPTNPQALDRYAYTLNNPVRYTDPSGHCIQVEDGFCLRAAKNGGYHIVHSERERFANYVEEALADFVLSRDPTSLNRIPGTEALFIGPALESACAGVGNPCGNRATIQLYVVMALTGAFGGAYPPPGIGPGGGVLARGGVYGDADCSGCGYTIAPRTPKQILAPGDQPVWRPGSNPRVGTVQSERQLRALFEALKTTGQLYKANYAGEGSSLYKLPGEQFVGWRIDSVYGPTMDVNVDGIYVTRVHLPFPE
jgi:RHS repeat-associated protein